MQMDTADSHLISAVSGQNVRPVKRTASEEPNTAPAAKRIEGSNVRLAEPDVQLPITIRRVPFLEKVCKYLKISGNMLTVF